MLVTRLAARVLKNAESLLPVEIELDVDPGAAVTIVPATVLEELGVAATGEETVALGGGDSGVRKVGLARVEIRGRAADTKVAFGAEGDRPILAPAVLEECGLMLDPATGLVLPTP